MGKAFVHHTQEISLCGMLTQDRQKHNLPDPPTKSSKRLLHTNTGHLLHGLLLENGDEYGMRDAPFDSPKGAG